MRINWFSPLPPARTDIANFTARILPALAAQADVTLLTDRDGWDTSLEEHAEVRRFRGWEEDWIRLNRGDCTFYNLGNDAEFHVEAWRTSTCHPGIVILHETRLHNFFEGLFHHHLDHDLDQYLAVMQRHYGTRGRRDGERWWFGGLSIDLMNEHYPLTPLALEGAIAVVAHSDAASCADLGISIPLLKAALPYVPRAVPQRRVPTRDGEPVRLVIFGHLGRNRRIDSVLSVLADLPDRSRFTLDIYGRIGDEAELRRDIEAQGVESLVTYHGFVTDSRLAQALDDADLAVNLRYPSAGEASGSQLRIWDHALPSLVSDAGWYGGLPRDVVGFVRPHREHDDLRDHLLSFAADRSRYVAMGERGRQRLLQHHAPGGYVKNLLKLAADARELRVAQRGEVLATAMGRLTGLCGLSPVRAGPLHQKLSDRIFGLMGEGGSPTQDIAPPRREGDRHDT